MAPHREGSEEEQWRDELSRFGLPRLDHSVKFDHDLWQRRWKSQRRHLSRAQRRWAWPAAAALVAVLLAGAPILLSLSHRPSAPTQPTSKHPSAIESPLTMSVLSMRMTSPANAFALVTLSDSKLSAWSLHQMFSSSSSPEMALLRTSDGGAHWSDVTPPDPFSGTRNEFGSSLFFLNRTAGWLAIEVQGKGAGSTIAVARTTDAGTHWQVSTFSASVQGGLYLDFTTPQDGWILALSTPGAGQMEKVLYATIDGGKTWRQVSCSCNLSNTSLPNTSYPTGFSFNAKQGFVTALYHGDPYPWFYGSPDGGRTWQQIALPLPVAYRNDYANVYPPVFSGLDGSMSVQFVGQKASAIVVYKTRDGGQTWQPVGSSPVPSSANMATLGWSSPTDGYLLSPNGHKLYLTRDGGQSWAAEVLPPKVATALAEGIVPIVSFADPQHGLLIAPTRSGTANIYITADGARKWKALSPQVVTH